MKSLDLINLAPLMKLTSGRSEISVAMIDGPIAMDHPDLTIANIREISGKSGGSCRRADSLACVHGTFVAGILSAKRTSVAPAICPNCTLLVYPIFEETSSGNGQMPSATPDRLATALTKSIDAGARLVNLSVSLTGSSASGERQLKEILDYAANRGVIVVAAAGNQGIVGSSAITRHPWVIPVIGCDANGRPLSVSNLGGSIGRGGLSAPGSDITSLATDGKSFSSSGTSVATPFVTGAAALLWSAFPSATAARIRLAITQSYSMRRATLVPPLLNAWAAYQSLSHTNKHGRSRALFSEIKT